jgi:hypothetical protein
LNIVGSPINITDAFGPALCQQFGGQQGRIVATLAADSAHEFMATGVGQCVELALGPLAAPDRDDALSKAEFWTPVTLGTCSELHARLHPHRDSAQ